MNRRRMAVRRLLVIVLAVLSLGGVEGGQQMVEGHVGKCEGGKLQLSGGRLIVVGGWQGFAH